MSRPSGLTPRGEWRLTGHADCVRLLERTKVGMRTTDGRLLNADESKMPRLFMLDQDLRQLGHVGLAPYDEELKVALGLR